MGEIIRDQCRINISEVNERAARAAAGFRSLGIGRGDTIALCLRNDFAFFEAIFLGTIWISNSFGHHLPVTKSLFPAAS